MFYHDEKRNLLIYPLTAGAPLHALPDAKRVNGEYFAVPRTLYNSQVLRYFNYPVAPIIDDYDWPSAPGIKPYETQKLAANFMVLHRRCFNLSDMGVGKTLATLWAADWLMRQHPPNSFRALIVCPLSIMERVWGDALWKNFLSRRTYEVLYGSHSKRQEILAKSKADFLIVNFDGVGIGARTRPKFELAGLSRDLAARDDVKLVVVDEASSYRDARTKRHRIARTVIGARPYLWLLTGTPTPNAPTDSYGLAKLINNAFGKSFTTFQQESMVKIGQFKWVPQADGYEKARKLLSPAIRFDISQVWDGPPLTTQQRQVELTAEQKKLMAQLKRDLMFETDRGKSITAVHEAAARMKFLQISAGVVYDAEHNEHAVDAEPRVKELLSILEEISGKVLIFCSLTSIVRLVHMKIVANGTSCEMVYGATSQTERNRIFSDFQSDRPPRVLALDPGCAAHGLDLWKARTVIWATPTDKAELYSQGNKRAHRPGQKWPVTVVQLVSNKLEREIFRRIETNTSLQGALLDAVTRGDF